jgi:hypothetical protein
MPRTPALPLALPPAPTAAERPNFPGARNLRVAGLERLPAAHCVSPTVSFAARPHETVSAAVLQAAASPLPPRVRPAHVVMAAGRRRRRCCGPASRVHVHHVALPAPAPMPLCVQPHPVRLRSVRTRGVAAAALGHDAVQTDGEHGLCADGVAPAPLELGLQCVLAQLRQEVSVGPRRGCRGHRGSVGGLTERALLRAAPQSQPGQVTRPRLLDYVRAPVAAGKVAGRILRVPQGPEQRQQPHRGSAAR